VPPVFGRAAITSGIGPHSSLLFIFYVAVVLLQTANWMKRN